MALPHPLHLLGRPRWLAAVTLILALAGRAAAGPINVGPGDGATFDAVKGSTIDLSLPAGFFGAGSAPVDGTVALTNGGPGFAGALFTVTGNPSPQGPNQFSVPLALSQLGLQSTLPFQANGVNYGVFVSLDPSVKGNGQGSTLLTLTSSSKGSFSSSSVAFTPQVTLLALDGSGKTFSTSLAGPALTQTGSLHFNVNTGTLSGQLVLQRPGVNLVLSPTSGIQAAPEPTSLALAGLGGLGLLAWRRRQCSRRPGARNVSRE